MALPIGIAGFSLIEMLVATALIGVTVSILEAIIMQSVPNRDRSLSPGQGNEQRSGEIEWHSADLTAAEFVEPNRATPRPPLFDRRPTVNALDADLVVGAALRRNRSNQAEFFANQNEIKPQHTKRSSEPNKSDHTNVITDGNHATPVPVDVSFDVGRQRTAEPGILPRGSHEPYGILSWHNDFGSRAADLRPAPGQL